MPPSLPSVFWAASSSLITPISFTCTNAAQTRNGDYHLITCWLQLSTSSFSIPALSLPQPYHFPRGFRHLPRTLVLSSLSPLYLSIMGDVMQRPSIAKVWFLMLGDDKMSWWLREVVSPGLQYWPLESSLHSIKYQTSDPIAENICTQYEYGCFGSRRDVSPFVMNKKGRYDRPKIVDVGDTKYAVVGDEMEKDWPLRNTQIFNLGTQVIIFTYDVSKPRRNIQANSCPGQRKNTFWSRKLLARRLPSSETLPHSSCRMQISRW